MVIREDSAQGGGTMDNNAKLLMRLNKLSQAIAEKEAELDNIREIEIIMTIILAKLVTSIVIKLPPFFVCEITVNVI